MYNISMTSRDQVLTLINQSAGLSMTWDQVEFGTPAINNNPSKERNTELRIHGIPEFGFKGSTYIYYNRIDLDDFRQHARTPFVIQVDVEEGDDLTMQHIVDGFNRYFDSALEVEDVSDEHDLTIDYSDGIEFRLEASSWSYAYRGSVEFILRPMDVDIDEAVEDKLLDGLVLQLAPEED